MRASDLVAQMKTEKMDSQDKRKGTSMFDMLYYTTKGNASPRDKDRILVHALKADQDLAEEVIKYILDENEGSAYVCWRLKDPVGLFSGFEQLEIAQMQLYIPIVTKAFLDVASEYPAFSLEAMSSQGLFVMPILASPELIPAFTARFGNIHAIMIGSSDISTEIKKQLSRFFGGQELKDQIIRDAFTRRLFLSYRKKDKVEALRILKAVHDTKWGFAAETWYDDFITPGRDFNEVISEAMAKSKFVVLNVTPSLLEVHPDGEQNYVMKHEYPDAVRTGKPVIPIESLKTDRRQLEDAYPGIAETIHLDDKIALENALAEANAESGEDEKKNTFVEAASTDSTGHRDPYLTYLLGMAFYMGYRVEKDVTRAITYLENAAEHDVAEAAEQLFFTYVEGYEVPRDTQEAMKWQICAFDIFKKDPVSEEDVRNMKRILLDEGLAGALSVNQRIDESNGFCQDLIDAIDATDPDDESEMLIWKAECLLNQGDIDYGKPLPERSDEVNIRYMLQMTKAAEEILDEYYGDETSYYHRIKSVIYSSYSEYERLTRNYAKATAFMFMAIKSMNEALEQEPSYINRYKMAQMKTNLAGCRFLLSEQRGITSVMRANYLADSVIACDEAIRIYTQLYEERRVPSVADYLAQCYLNKSLALQDREEAKAVAKKGLEVIAMLEKDYPGEGQATKMKLTRAL